MSNEQQFSDLNKRIEREGKELLQQFFRYAMARFTLEINTQKTDIGVNDLVFLTYAPKYSRMDQHLTTANPDQLIIIPTYHLGNLPLSTRRSREKPVMRKNLYCPKSAIKNVAQKLCDAIRLFEENKIKCDMLPDEGEVAINGVEYFADFRDDHGPLAPRWLTTYRTGDEDSQKLLELLLR